MPDMHCWKAIPQKFGTQNFISTNYFKHLEGKADIFPPKIKPEIFAKLHPSSNCDYKTPIPKMKCCESMQKLTLHLISATGMSDLTLVLFDILIEISLTNGQHTVELKMESPTKRSKLFSLL